MINNDDAMKVAGDHVMAELNSHPTTALLIGRRSEIGAGMGMESEASLCRRQAQRCRELAKLSGPSLAAKLLSIAIEYDVEALKARMVETAGNKPARPRAG